MSVCVYLWNKITLDACLFRACQLSRVVSTWNSRSRWLLNIKCAYIYRSFVYIYICYGVQRTSSLSLSPHTPTVLYIYCAHVGCMPLCCCCPYCFLIEFMRWLSFVYHLWFAAILCGVHQALLIATDFTNLFCIIIEHIPRFNRICRYQAVCGKLKDLPKESFSEAG